jgi:hypothetical protein
VVVAGLVAVTVTTVTGRTFHADDSSSVSFDGPVRLGDNPGTICLPRSADDALTMGFDVIRNTKHTAVRITDVTLLGARGLRITASYLMPVQHDQLVGVTNRWPPPHATNMTEGDWNQRIQAVGAGRLGPTSGVPDWNLVLS